MGFDSLAFGVLVICTLVVYYVIPWKNSQICVLILSSLVFYSYENPYLTFLLLFTSSVSALASYVNARGATKYRRAVTGAAVVVCLLVLGFFKYSGLLLGSFVSQKTGIIHALVMLPLPIGISFYTFQAISLLVDSFRDPRVLHVPSSNTPGSFLTHYRDSVFFLAFFPQLVSGPIMKAHDFFPQISRKRLADIDLRLAAKALVTGYFLKRLVADNLAQMTVALPYQHQWIQMGSDELLSMLIGFSAQIFADFAGYSLIAIGVAELFGYKLIQNFNAPYLSTSFSEFWRRWHISLSTWLKEYLYFPLGGNRRGRVRTYFNLLMVMFLGGLWHGADWKFALWGLWHGAALAIERLLAETFRSRFPALAVQEHSALRVPLRAVRWLLVLSVVTVGWLFFSLGNVADVPLYLEKIINWSVRGNHTHQAQLAITYSLVAIVAAHHLMERIELPRQQWFQRIEAYALGFLLFLTIAAPGPKHAFIYFQF